MLRFVVVGCVLLVLLSRIAPYVVPGWRARLLRFQVALDIAGGLIVIALIVLHLAQGEEFDALVLVLLGIPIWLGAYRSFPAWWRGQ
jgi:hypothetical protein